MIKYFFFLLFILFFCFLISPSLGVFMVIILIIFIPIIKFFSNLEDKRDGKRIGRINYYADEEYSNLLDKNITYCSNCGNQLYPDDRFCSKCGKALNN